MGIKSRLEYMASSLYLLHSACVEPVSLQSKQPLAALKIGKLQAVCSVLR